MRYLIVSIMLCMASFIIQAQEYTAEYKMVCKRITGCPVVNGTCPTCEIVQNGKTVKQFDYDAWGKKLNENLKYMWESSLENDLDSSLTISINPVNVKETSIIVYRKKQRQKQMVIHDLMVSLQSFSFHTKMFLSPSILIKLMSVNKLVQLYVCL